MLVEASAGKNMVCGSVGCEYWERIKDCARNRLKVKRAVMNAPQMKSKESSKCFLTWTKSPGDTEFERMAPEIAKKIAMFFNQFLVSILYSRVSMKNYRLFANQSRFFLPRARVQTKAQQACPRARRF
jgi:hypothetical protein